MAKVVAHSKVKRLYNPALGPLNDFKNFLYLVWQFLDTIKKDPTELQYDIADYLQTPDKAWTIIMAYRGVGKSYITIAYVCWLFLINPEFKISVYSASQDLAKKFAAMVKDLINSMPELESLRPKRTQRKSVLSFDVGGASPAKDPSLSVKGIGGHITGGRADFMILDDIEVPENSDTVGKRESLKAKLNEVLAIIKPDIYGYTAQIKVLGTPQTQQSIYYDLTNRGFGMRVWPARYPVEVDTYGGHFAPMLQEKLDENPELVGAPTNPKLHGHDDLIERANGGKAWFQLQFMLDPALSDADRYPLKLKDFLLSAVDMTRAPVHLAWADDGRTQVSDTSIPIVGMNGDYWVSPFNVSDQWLPYQQKIMAIDPGGGKDETAYVVLYALQGFLYLAEWGGVMGFGNDALTTLAKVAQAHKVDTIVLEKNMGHGTYTSLFQSVLMRYHRATIEEIHHNKQKEVRICDTLEPVLASHRLIISPNVVKKDYEAPLELQGLFQLTHITRDRGALVKDDRVDALAMGVAFFADMVMRDVLQNESRLKAEMDDESLKHFMSLVNIEPSNDDFGHWLDYD